MIFTSRFQRTRMHRAIETDFVPEHYAFSAVDRRAYDLANGSTQCYMPPIAAMAAAFAAMSVTVGSVAVTGAMVMNGLMIAGAALSVAGMVTGNETLGWIGAGVGLVGGLGSGLASLGESMAVTAAAEGAGQAAANATKAATVAKEIGTKFPASNAFSAAADVAPQMGARMPGTIPTAGAMPTAGVPKPGIPPTVTPSAAPINPMATNPLSTSSSFTPTGGSVLDKWTKDFSTSTAANRVPGFGTPAGSGGFLDSVGGWASDNPTAAMIGGTTLASTIAPMIPTKLSKSQRGYYDANAANVNQNTDEAKQRLRWDQGII